MTAESEARLVIDEKLKKAGWELQDIRQLNLSASMGVAVREYVTDTGPADYILFINKVPVGVIEAKSSKKGENLTIVEEQSRRYAESKLKWIINSKPLRFAYEATDVLTHFTDYKDEKARAREVFSFHRPDTLMEWLREDDTLRNNLKKHTPFDCTGFRTCQITAITNLEESFAENKPRALIQMATGAGKTFTAITAVYRLLRHAKAKRILFLVDTKNLGEQAEEEFRRYKPADDARLFPEIYNVCRLTSSSIPRDANVCISTIQRMYSILRGEEMDESLEEVSPNEYVDTKKKEVVYNQKYPIEFFDFIIIDECHRSIYNVWKQVLDYFDAFLIGLTATPDKRTFAFFNENVVSEYSHEQAVIDKVNVGSDEYIIETNITKNGSYIIKQIIEKRVRLTRQKRWEQLDEDISYKSNQLDREVVNPSQIRTIIRTFKEKALTEMFHGRKEIPKTLIFAKTDSHAEDIVQIVREEFGEGNEFCKKITYQADNPKSVLSAFRNDYYPRIAVTVDMIATGIDVKPIECLLFMRDIHSKNYYEQMKGRGTRVLSKDDLQKVTPSAAINKDRFVIVDAVGVTSSLKSDSRPLERNPTVSLKELMMTVALGSRDENIMTSLANRLIRLNCQMDDKERATFREKSGGTHIKEVASNLLNCFDPEMLEKSSQTQDELKDEACEPFSLPALRDFIENVRRSHEQIIDDLNLDRVVYVGPSADLTTRAGELISTFREFIEENKDEITALSIIYNQSYRNRGITFEMIKELHEKLSSSPFHLTPDGLWKSYSVKYPDKIRGTASVRMLTDIVSLIRFELGYADSLVPFSDSVNYNFMKWTMTKNAGNIQFTQEQMEWLRMIKDHIVTSISITPDDLELSPFNERGGLGKFYEIFGQSYQNILAEMNLALVV